MSLLTSVREIKFGILSPKEIEKMSVAEITNPDTFEAGRPKKDGLYDTRMGVIDPDEICPTDNTRAEDNIGYFGHIELGKPVFNINYIDTIRRVLGCVSFKGSNLLVNKSDPVVKDQLKNISKRPANIRLKLLQKIIKEEDPITGAIQPKIIKDNNRLMYEYPDDESIDKRKKLTPEMAYYILKGISNEDCQYLGFSPKYSRPEWMIISVLPVPPPQVRPASKVENMSQRSEDDTTHRLIDIIKFNQLIKKRQNDKAVEKIEPNVDMLQYYIATLFNNAIPKIPTTTHRMSNRPLKGYKQKLEKKEGRFRGNLMGKRVNFSARTVITADPNISVDELGVPKDICMTLTKPVVVTKYNMNEMYKYIYNGPNKYPGAKTITFARTGQKKTLKYMNVADIKLEIGDIIERHMIDGDYVLFNRQPTLHLESMMSHRIKAMEGMTFRLSISATKPYNADFDGDEMNLHLPQNIESSAELRNLSAVTKLLVSSEDSAPFIGIFQDSLVGSYRLTRDDVRLTKKQMMNLLMYHDEFNGVLPEPIEKDTAGNPLWSGRQIISLILPKINMYKENKPLPGIPKNDKNDKIIIENGELVSGQLSKSVISASAGALHHIIYLDATPEQSRDFLDRITRISNNWLLYSGFSIGAKHMVTPKQAIKPIEDAIGLAFSKVNEKIKLVNKGLLDAQLGKTVAEQFEQEVFSILQGVSMESIKSVLPYIDQDNSILNMISAGSKGKAENIQQIMCTLGQQALNGGRIPMNFKDRTLPHFQKYDVSPAAKGFISNSFFTGMEPIEFFMSQVAGREGSIDTAVKTASTGYTQRKLMKGMEDGKVHYDNTVRNINNQIIQFMYGDDGLDPRYIERQKMNLYIFNNETLINKYKLSLNELKENLTPKAFKEFQQGKFDLEAEYKTLYNYREELRNNYFKGKDNDDIQLPVNIKRLLDITKNKFGLNKIKKCELTPQFIYENINKLVEELPVYYKLKKEDINDIEINACYLFKILILSNLSVKQVICDYHLTKEAFEYILDTIRRKFNYAIVTPGFMAGPVAAQSIGHPITQATLNTFHLSGVASASKTTRGIGRITELLSLSHKVKTEVTTLALTEEFRTQREKSMKIGANIKYTVLGELVSRSYIYFDPTDKNTNIQEDTKLIQDFIKYNMDEEIIDGMSNWIIRYEIDKESLIYEQVRMRDIKKKLYEYNRNISVIYSDDNADKLIIRIRVNPTKLLEKENDEFKAIRLYEQELLENVVIKGIPNISDVEIVPSKNIVFDEKGEMITQNNWGIMVNGFNLMKLFGVNGIDYTKSYSNNIHEIYQVLGVEAARIALLKELVDSGVETNYHHLTVLIDTMTYRGYLMSIDRHGINRSDISPFARASFEETTEQLVNASMFAELDNINGVSANIMLGKMHKGGTGAFDVLINEKYFNNSQNIEDKFD